MKQRHTSFDPSHTVYPILVAIAFAHLLNDLLQAIIPALYPLFKESLSLTFTQIGLISLAFQLTSSLFQPVVGWFTDKHPQPFSFVVGMLSTTVGVILLAFAKDFYGLLFASSLVGFGSSIFHPESSKLAYYASGGKRGLAQSIFQLGGNTGSAIGPLLVASVVVSYGQQSILTFVAFAALALFVLFRVGKWYAAYLQWKATAEPIVRAAEKRPVDRKVVVAIGILLVLIFSKFFYNASMSSYFTFYLMERFDIGVQASQYYLFWYLLAVAAGTLLGGPIGDRYGRKFVIWFSILGVAPFTLVLPYLSFEGTIVCALCIGFILASAFSAILVYAQELLPGRIGMVSGLFFGFAFGMGGLGSAVLGSLADSWGIHAVFQLCSFLPLVGLLTVFLPNVNKK